MFVHTFGCQMNVYDSDRMLQALAADGYEETRTLADADLVLVNTCSVRDKAEKKLLSALGVYRRHKAKAPRPILICVAGCVAQQQRSRLLERAPFVDLIIGPDQVHRIGEITRRARSNGERIIEVSFTEAERYAFPRAEPKPGTRKATAFVTIQKGCDKLCTYCIVPFTRGREVSRPHGEVLDEVRRFVESGAREVSLIGQNVNCYAGGCRFEELLHRVAAVPGVERLRYATSHPSEMTEHVFDAHRDIPALCPHLHLPVQSGSDRILSLMGREHLVSEYLEKVLRLREARPDMALTTDIIVGFPGERDEDFAGTMSLVEEVRFTNMFSFVYSDRPRTWAARHGDELGRVSPKIQVERLETLQRRQREISSEEAAAWLGRDVEVLVEGQSKKDPLRRRGHSEHNWIVHFAASEEDAPVGAMARVRVERTSHVGLSGRLEGIVSWPVGFGESHA